MSAFLAQEFFDLAGLRARRPVPRRAPGVGGARRDARRLPRRLGPLGVPRPPSPRACTCSTDRSCSRRIAGSSRAPCCAGPIIVGRRVRDPDRRLPARPRRARPGLRRRRPHRGEGAPSSSTARTRRTRTTSATASWDATSTSARAPSCPTSRTSAGRSPSGTTGQPSAPGLRKFGAVLGDGCRTGCNTVLNPGVLMGPGCVTYPNVSLRSGYYPPRTLDQAPPGAAAGRPGTDRLEIVARVLHVIRARSEGRPP